LTSEILVDEESYPGEREELLESVSTLADALQRHVGASHPVYRMMREAATIGELVLLRVAMDSWAARPEYEKKQLLGKAKEPIR
jgi:hypothetical protein